MNKSDVYFDRIHKELDEDSDRAVVIVATAMVDDALKELINAKLLPAKNKEHCIISNPSSPLGTFSSRINACYQIGLISESMHRDLHILRKLRNDFAHNPFDLTFESSSVKSRVIELDKISNYLIRNKEARDNVASSGTRGDFIFSIGWRLYSLTCNIEKIEKSKIQSHEFGYVDFESFPEEIKQLFKDGQKT